MADLGNHYKVGDVLVIPFQTRDSSNAPTDADAVPDYQIYERGGTTAVTTGSGAKRDDANTTGYYEAEVTLASGTGFEQKFYVVRKLAVIGGDTVVSYDTFAIRAGTTSFPSLAGWPTLLDVQTRLSEMGLTAPSDDTIEAQIAAAVAAWEGMTNYAPFLGTGDDETRYLDGDGCLIDFGGGLTAAPTSLTINGNYNDSGVYENGTALVVNRDYRLYPQNALAKGGPYTYCKLSRYHSLLTPGNVKIVAPFGYAESVPSDAWEAVMKEVLMRLTPQLMIAESGGFDSVRQGPVEWRNQQAGGTFRVSHEMLSGEARECASRYRRLVLA